MLRFRSVVSRIAALHLVAIIATSLFMPLALFLMLRHAALELHQRALRDHAGEIAGFIRTTPDGGLRLDMPPALAELYSEAYGRYAFAVLDEDGAVLFSSLPDRRALAKAPQPQRDIAYFSHGRSGAELFGASVPAAIGGHRLHIQVAQDLAHRDVLIDDIVAEFFGSVGWITVPILLLLLIIDVGIFRRALKPIIAASSLAERIGPNRTELRLPEPGMPKEVLPLVRAVNQALDRLDEGFRNQREFTANAAHELRTPLTILRTQIDMIADRELAQALRNDVESMSRLVNQLLEMAELETFVIGEDEVADLGAVTADIAAFLAPLALARRQSVAVAGVAGPVLVRGNSDMIGRAVRNLVENALAHTPPGTAVEIEVDPGGTVRVGDSGPGVPPAERERIFRRFWRGDRRRVGGAGLGLSIVARIAEMHGAAVSVEDRVGGGAVFALRLALAAPGEATTTSPEPAFAPHAAVPHTAAQQVPQLS